MSGEAVKMVLVRGLSDGGTRFLAHRLETAFGFSEDVPVDELLEDVCYEDIFKILKAPEWVSKAPKKDRPSISLAAEAPMVGSASATPAAPAASRGTFLAPAGRMADVVTFNPAIGITRSTATGGSSLAPA